MADLIAASAALYNLGIANNSTNLAVISAIAIRTDDIIAGWCNRHPDGFLSASHTEKFDGLCSDRFVMTYTPITGSPVITVDGQTVDSSLYIVENESGIVGIKWSDYDMWFQGGAPLRNYAAPQDFFSLPNFGRGFRACSVTYTGGYASGSIPGDLQQCAIEVIGYLYAKRSINPLIQSKTLGDLSYTSKSSKSWRDFQQEMTEMYLDEQVRKAVLFTP